DALPSTPEKNVFESGQEARCLLCLRRFASYNWRRLGNRGNLLAVERTVSHQRPRVLPQLLENSGRRHRPRRGPTKMLEDFLVGGVVGAFAEQKLSQVCSHDRAFMRGNLEGIAADVGRGNHVRKLE